MGGVGGGADSPVVCLERESGFIVIVDELCERDQQLCAATPVPVSSIEPALPLPAELPVFSCISPELPELVVPVVNAIRPLTPSTPASAVFSTTAPLDVAVPAPAVTDTAPPVTALLLPPVAWIEPPASVELKPPVILM